MLLLEELRQQAAELKAEELREVDVFKVLEYEPTARQQVFHDATEFDVLYGGAAGGGKTKALLMHGIRACVQYPGLRVGAFRRTYDELAESLLKELASVDFAKALGAHWNGSVRELTFPNRSVIRFRYLETVQDATRRQGGEYQLVLLDERTMIPPDAVSIVVNERIRSGDTAIPVLGVRSGTNPGDIGHAFVRERYIVATDHGAKTYTDDFGRSVRFVPAKVTDNPYIEAASPGYINWLQSIPDPARRAAMSEGSWDMFAGQVFSEWRYDKHVVPRFAIPPEWRRVAGVDYGYAAPWCALWAAVDQDRRVWLYREEYATQVGETDQAKRILAAEAAAGESSAARFADPSMWRQTGEGLPVSGVYGQQGVGLIQANNERLAGWQRVHTYLSDRPACAHHRAQGLDVCPMLHVLDGTCPNLVRTLPALPYDKHKIEDVDTLAEDHAGDALRYLLMGIEGGPEWYFPPVAPTTLDGRPFGHEVAPGIVTPARSGGHSGWAAYDAMQQGIRR